jgi:hypothetical protein
VNNKTRDDIASLLANNFPLEIVSGEGAQGTCEPYNGALTVRAVLARLTRERAGGDRWARVQPAPNH